jgi:hypothetical protein
MYYVHFIHNIFYFNKNMKTKKEISTLKEIVDICNFFKMSSMPFEGGSNFIYFKISFYFEFFTMLVIP